MTSGLLAHGPAGDQKLLVTHGTQMVLTNSGSAILERLSIAHSMGAFVQAVVKVRTLAPSQLYLYLYMKRTSPCSAKSTPVC